MYMPIMLQIQFSVDFHSFLFLTVSHNLLLFTHIHHIADNKYLSVEFSAFKREFAQLLVLRSEDGARLCCLYSSNNAPNNGEDENKDWKEKYDRGGGGGGWC